MVRKAKPKPPSTKKVLDGKVTKQNEQSFPLKKDHLHEELAKLREELKKKDAQLKRTEEILRETERTLGKIAEKHKIFYRFPYFPPELRYMVYSKLHLRDRVAAAQACPDMATYFMNNRLRTNVKISLEEENEKAYVRIQYRHQKYIEMYEVPDELVASVERDLASSRGCRCWNFCSRDKFVGPDGNRITAWIQYFECDVGDMREVLDTFTLIKIGSLELKSAPVGGLVDLLQPEGIHPEPLKNLNLTWHLQKLVVYRKNDPDFVVENWARWLDYLRPEKMSIVRNSETYSIGADWDSDSDSSEYYKLSRKVFVPKELFELQAMRNLDGLVQTCSVDISYRQLMNMKATTLTLHGTESKYLTELDLLEFYKHKLQEWLLAPDTEFSYSFRSAEKSTNPPYLNYAKLLEDVREQLTFPEYRIYPDYDMNCPHSKYKSITIRNIEFERSLVITDGNLFSGVPKGSGAKHLWPAKHGLEL